MSSVAMKNRNRCRKYTVPSGDHAVLLPLPPTPGPAACCTYAPFGTCTASAVILFEPKI